MATSYLGWRYVVPVVLALSACTADPMAPEPEIGQSGVSGAKHASCAGEAVDVESSDDIVSVDDVAETLEDELSSLLSRAAHGWGLHRRHTDWPEFHHDPSLLGFTRSPAPVSNALLWKVDLGTRIGGAGSPVVVGKSVYIGTEGGDVFSLDKLSGVTQWVHNVGFSIDAAPAVGKKRVFVHDVRGVVTALDATTGTVVWSDQLPVGAGEWSSPALDRRNVFVGSDYGDLWNLSADTGAENWVTAISDTTPGPVSVADNTVFAGLLGVSLSPVLPTFAAVTENDLSGPHWSYFYGIVHGTPASMPFSNGGAIADVDDDGALEVCFGVIPMTDPAGHDALVCLDEKTGTERFTMNLHGASQTTPAVHKHRIFIGSDDGNLYAINGVTQEVLWTFAGGPTCSAPVVSGNGEVCYGTLDHVVYCLGEKTGTLVWSFPTGQTTGAGVPSCLIPALSDGVMVVGDGTKLFAFGRKC